MKKSPKYLSLVAFAMLILGTFSVSKAQAFSYDPGDYGGSPVVDSFDAFNSRGWVISGTHNAGYSSQTNTGTDCVISNCVVSHTVGSLAGNYQAVMQNTTAALAWVTLGITVYGKVVPSGSFFNHACDIHFFDQSGADVDVGTACDTTVGPYNGFHKYDVLMSATSTGANYYYATREDNGTWSAFSRSTAVYTYGINEIQLLMYNSSSDTDWYFDELSVFTGDITSPIANIEAGAIPPGIVATSTVTYCNSLYSTSTIFAEFASGVAVGFCNVGSFLFTPSQYALNNFSNLKAQLTGKFPFSYVVSVAATWDALIASSTANLPAYAYSLHDLGLGSTTAIGNFLPNVTVLSSSTIETYDSVGAIGILKTLAGFAIILTLIADIFFTSRNLLHA